MSDARRKIDDFTSSDALEIERALVDGPKTIHALARGTLRRIPTTLAVMRDLLQAGRVEAVPGQPGFYRLTDADEHDGVDHERTRRENPRE